MLHVIIIILTVLVAILLIGIVLIQKSKGGGLSSQFGGANAVVGVRQTNSFLEKGTWTLAALIVVLSVASAYTIPTAKTAEIRTEAAAPAAAPGSNQFDSKAADKNATPTNAAADLTKQAEEKPAN